MAEAIFNKLKPTGFLAISAGTRPAEEVNPLVVQALSEIGIDAGRSRPKPITQDMVVEAERIITMGCEAEEFCPVKFLPKVEDWKIEDPKGRSLEEVRSIRDNIRQRVEVLLEELRG